MNGSLLSLKAPSTFSFLFLLPLLALAGGSAHEKARILFEKTDYPASARILEGIKDKSAADLNLLGRDHFMMGEYKKATELLEKAAQLEPQVSAHWLWLGRCFGRRAELSTFVTAPGYANKARQNFERAVQADPSNAEALADLFEYYLQAPGFLGGGLDKAQDLVERIGAADPVEKQWAMARLAEQKKDFKSAEAHLRRSIELAPRQVGRIVDLAMFLAKRGRTPESDAIFAQAQRVDPNHPTYLWRRANALIDGNRNLTEAKLLLEKYLSTQMQPDDDHKEEARKLLTKIHGA